jgi:hypothetical protein
LGGQDDLEHLLGLAVLERDALAVFLVAVLLGDQRVRLFWFDVDLDGELGQRAAFAPADQQHLRAVGAGAGLDVRQPLDDLELGLEIRNLAGFDLDLLLKWLVAVAARDAHRVLARLHLLQLNGQRTFIAIVDAQAQSGAERPHPNARPLGLLDQGDR